MRMSRERIFYLADLIMKARAQPQTLSIAARVGQAGHFGGSVRVSFQELTEQWLERGLPHIDGDLARQASADRIATAVSTDWLISR